MENSSPRPILIIDDEDVLLNLMIFHLSPLYRCATATSAEQALEMMEHDSFDLVLTDIKLSGKDGFHVCEIVRSRFPKTVIMMMTGMQGALYARKALDAGVFSFVTKPLEFSRLKSLVESALAHQTMVANRHSKQPR